jgi:hypothetical protein
MRMHEIWKRRCSNATLRPAYTDTVMLLTGELTLKNVWLCLLQRVAPSGSELEQNPAKELDRLKGTTHGVKSKCGYVSLNPNSSWNPCDISAIYWPQ